LMKRESLLLKAGWVYERVPVLGMDKGLGKAREEERDEYDGAKRGAGKSKELHVILPGTACMDQQTNIDSLGCSVKTEKGDRWDCYTVERECYR